MNSFYTFMTSNTKWNLPVWFAGAVVAVVAGLQLVYNIVTFIGV
jgi:hypothetical protein